MIMKADEPPKFCMIKQDGRILHTYCVSVTPHAMDHGTSELSGIFSVGFCNGSVQ
eukprot:SAG11_NODE_12469_length_701_cov_1.451827_2_plen_54_part_01